MDNGHTPIAESTDVRRLSEPSDSKSPDPQIPLELLNEIEAGDIEVESQEPSLLATHSGKGRDEDEATVVAENYLDAQPPDSHMATPENEKTKLQDQTNILPFKQLIIVFLGLSCALFCSLLDQTIVSTALPTLGRVFNNASISSWVGTAYLLTSTACQPMYGRLSDIFGRKRVLLSSMLIFLVGSILCAVSQSMIMLIVFRAISGIGGGGILTCVMIVISDVVSLEKRGKYQGLIGVVVMLGNSLGPIIGGIFSEKVSWRWCFYINIPLTSMAIIVVAFALPLKRVEGNMKVKLKQIDYLGSGIMLLSAFAILLPLSWGGTQYGWSSAAVIVPLVLGTLLLVIFFFVEIKLARIPIIPLHIFKDPTVASALTGSFLSGIMFYGNLYYLPQFYQVIRGASPIRSGVLLLPLITLQTVTSFATGFLVSQTQNYRISLWFGFGIWAIACGLLSTISPTISDSKLIGYQILSGIGAGQTFQTGLIAIQASVKREEMAVATGARNFMRLLGGTVALAICSAILNNTVRMELRELLSSELISMLVSDPTQIRGGVLALTAEQQSAAIYAYTHGIRNIYYLMTPCCSIACLLSIFFIKAHSLRRDDDEKRKQEGKQWIENHKGKKLRGLKRKGNDIPVEEGVRVQAENANRSE